MTEMTPLSALTALKEGNARFVNGEMQKRDLMSQVQATAGGQSPYAVILGCIDSRVPPELVFDQGIGDIFTARIAGNFVNTDLLGSIEFATKVVGSKLVLVLGHSRCGAVCGACDGVELGNLTATLANLQSAVDAVQNVEGPRDSTNAEFVKQVAEENVRQNVQAMTVRSEVMSDLVAKGELAIVGAMHDVATGRVTFMD